MFQGCGNRLCVNPSHTRDVRNRTEYGLHVRRAGWLVGVAVDAKREALKAARKANGIVTTPADVVSQIRAMRGLSGKEVARRLNIGSGVVYDVRHGRTHRQSLELAGG